MNENNKYQVITPIPSEGFKPYPITLFMCFALMMLMCFCLIKMHQLPGQIAARVKVIEKTESKAQIVSLTKPQVSKKKVAKKSNKKPFKKDREYLMYIDRFAAVAIAEMKKYGVPASITIAQGLLETRAGESSLAKKNNNHFGMKCFSKKCKKGHCSNYHDDGHKDFFRIYNSAWESYRAHSKHVTSGERYKHLPSHGNDYKKWAHGLKKAGYATDPKYADKLIRLIENYELYKLDI